jgi:hypothetical protein
VSVFVEDRHGADLNFGSSVRRRAPQRAEARMPGQYPIGGSFRPRLCDEGKQADTTARLYLCERCRIQVLICTCCDRGNIYCEQGCATENRCSKQRASGQRYQSSPRGRRKHAERARRYRARRQKVTHQGSLSQAPDAVMPESSVPPPTPRSFPLQPPWRCHWCGRPCMPFVRIDFLRRRRGSVP